MHLQALALATALTTAAFASPITVHVEWPAGKPAGIGSVPVIVTAERIAGGEPAIIEGEPSTADDVQIDLADGSEWAVSLTSTQNIAADIQFVSTRVRLSDTTQSVVVHAWPGGTLRGRLLLDGRVASPRTPKMDMRYQIAGDAEKTGDLPCDVLLDRFTCRVPAVRFDGAFHVAGYAPSYRWSEDVALGEIRDVGTVDLKRGASVIGRVITRDAAPPASNVTVSLVPENLSMTAREDATARRVLTRTTRPNARGVFQFEGVAPGEYRLSASARAFVSDTREVRVIANNEAELREPLVLAPPRSLKLHINPPFHPTGGRWTVKLSSYDERAGELTPQRRDDALPDGTWATTGLLPGSYIVSIEHGTHEKWLSKELTLDADTDMPIPIPVVGLRGRVTIGDNQPVANAILWFGGDRGAVSIPVPTRDDGTYRTILPVWPNDTWPEVDIVCEKPPIRRALHDVRLDVHEQKAVLDITLPDTSVWGEVLDPSGKVVPLAYVLARSDDASAELVEVRADAAGAYRLTGLPPGRVTLRARSQYMLSAATTITVAQTHDDTGPYVPLTLQSPLTVSGVVRAFGTPVPGARVVIIPTDRRNFVAVPVTTDVKGYFETETPASSTLVAVAVAAPGFAFKFLETRVVDGQVNVDVQQNGGTLDVALPKSPNEIAYVVHNGTYLPIGSISAFSGSAQFGDGHVLITDMEPGAYSLCFRTFSEAATVTTLPERCVSKGFLSTNGRLILADTER